MCFAGSGMLHLGAVLSLCEFLPLGQCGSLGCCAPTDFVFLSSESHSQATSVHSLAPGNPSPADGSKSSCFYQIKSSLSGIGKFGLWPLGACSVFHSQDLSGCPRPFDAQSLWLLFVLQAAELR